MLNPYEQNVYLSITGIFLYNFVEDTKWIVNVLIIGCGIYKYPNSSHQFFLASSLWSEVNSRVLSVGQWIGLQKYLCFSTVFKIPELSHCDEVFVSRLYLYYPNFVIILNFS